MSEKLVFVYTTKIAAKQPNNCNAYGIRYDGGQGNVRSPPDAKAGDDATKLKSLLLASEAVQVASWVGR
jgi:hypothetical protein